MEKPKSWFESSGCEIQNLTNKGFVGNECFGYKYCSKSNFNLDFDVSLSICKLILHTCLLPKNCSETYQGYTPTPFQYFQSILASTRFSVLSSRLW